MSAHIPEKRSYNTRGQRMVRYILSWRATLQHTVAGQLIRHSRPFEHTPPPKKSLSKGRIAPPPPPLLVAGLVLGGLGDLE